jgi:hypothetical protein
MFGARFTAFLIFAVSLGSALAEPLLVVSIVTAPTPGQAAQHGIAKIIAALKDKQVSFETVNSQDAERQKLPRKNQQRTLYKPVHKGFWLLRNFSRWCGGSCGMRGN